MPRPPSAPPPRHRRSILCLLAWLAAIAATAGARAERPNIVFILTDDQAPWAFGAVNPAAHTPNLDRLKREGVYLPNLFVTTPVCSPSRASIVTSRYGTELGITDFIPFPTHPAYTPATGDVGLATDTTTFIELLARAGYVTGLVGKWHLGDWTKLPHLDFHPTRHGFGYFMGLTGGGTTAANPKLEEDGFEREMAGLTDDLLADRAVAFLERNRDNRFLLCFNTRAPHAPWLPALESDLAPYAGVELPIPNPDYPDLDVPRAKRMMSEYLTSVTGADRNIGRILDTIDRLGLTGSTVVIFTSDNGMNMGHNGIWAKGDGLRLTKSQPPDTPNIPGRFRPNLYDNSIRVPSIIRWPGRIPAGSEVERTASCLDWYPTILAMAGVRAPDGLLLRGRNLLPLLQGAEVAEWDDGLFGEYSMRVYCRTDLRMYRTPAWKLVRDFRNPERDELYHLRRDPAETTNLIPQLDRPDVRAAYDELNAAILRQMAENQDRAGDATQVN